jgi:hypothetical protein
LLGLLVAGLAMGQDVRVGTSVALVPTGQRVAVRVAGLAVVHEALETEKTRYRPFGLETGTRVSLVFHAPAGGLVCFDAPASRIDSMTDDTGGNLLAMSSRFQTSGFLARSAGIQANGALAHLEIFGGTPPAAGAKSIDIRGVAVFRTATRQAKLVSPVAVAGIGHVFDAGGRFSFKVVRWEKDGAASKDLRMALAYDGDPRQLAGFRFLGADGREIPSRQIGQSVDEGKAGTKAYYYFQIETAPPAFSLEATCWDDMRPIDVPLAVTVDLGGRK